MKKSTAVKGRAPTIAEGTWSAKQNERKAKNRLGRRRVCAKCITAGDIRIGSVHSALECDRCSISPCKGFITYAEVAR
jgi:hypothetical protein